MKKILIVDDDEAILEAFELVLTDAGYSTETAIKDGDHVFRKIQTFKPDLIILDLLLSGTDGRTVCRKLKMSTQYQLIPVLMMSAHPDASQAAKEAGANDFLAKPFEIDDLLKKVKKYTS